MSDPSMEHLKRLNSKTRLQLISSVNVNTDHLIELSVLGIFRICLAIIAIWRFYNLGPLVVSGLLIKLGLVT
jgi:hypothetical protein